MGQRVEISVPIEGDPAFLEYRGHYSPTEPLPTRLVDGNRIVFPIDDFTLSQETLLRTLDRTKAYCEQFLNASLGDAAKSNEQLRVDLRERVQIRRQKLLMNRALTDALPFPVRRVDDVDNSFPITARRKTVALPHRTSDRRYQAEPRLEEQHYEEIVRMILGWAATMERTPISHVWLGELVLRDILLGQLNSRWEGQAAGELFNGEGRTDILVRHGDRNVFIAECKIWSGQAAVEDALHQLLRYLVWRDTKAALLMFITIQNATQVLKDLHAAVEAHPQWVRTVEAPDPEHRRDYVFHANDDEQRAIKLAVLPVIIRNPGTRSGQKAPRPARKR